MPTNQFSEKHIPALDGWRGTAIGMVLVWHLWPPINLKAQWYTTFGWWGVDLFFVLSGFLITRILLAAKGSPHYFRNFYARRTLRIFPLYYLALFLVFVLWPAFAHVPAYRTDGAAAAAYGTNILMAAQGRWLRTPPPFVAAHFWSLAVEEQFYLVWPAVVLLLSRRQLAWACAACWATSIVGRLVLSWAGVPWTTGYGLTPTHMDGLAAGALLAVAGQSERGRAAARTACRWMLPLSVVGLVAVGLRCRGWDLMNQPIVRTVGISLNAPLFVSLLYLTIGRPTGNRLDAVMRLSPLRWFGRYSYGLYVYHGLLIIVFENRLWPRVQGRVHNFRAAEACFFLLAVAACCAIAFASYHLFERPLLDLKRRFPEPPPTSTIRAHESIPKDCGAGRAPGAESPTAAAGVDRA